MSDSAITYTLYIQADPARVWQALTEPALTRRYWGLSFETDWGVGSPMDWVERGTRTSDPEQVVLGCVPDRLLSYTWHTFTPSGRHRPGSARSCGPNWRRSAVRR